MSGGTANSILSTMESASISEMLKSLDNYCLAATPVPRTRPTQHKSIIETICGVRTVPNLGTLTTVPSGMADESIVMRSSTLMPDLYGPSFSYRQYLRVSNALRGALFHFAFRFTISLLVFAPFRWIFRQILPAPGGGPPREEAAKNDYCEYRVRISSNQNDKSNGNPRTVLGSIAYQSGQYVLTGAVAAAAAKVVLERESEIKKISSGFVTPATLGQPYVDELEKSGFKFEVKVLE